LRHDFRIGAEELVFRLKPDLDIPALRPAIIFPQAPGALGDIAMERAGLGLVLARQGNGILVGGVAGLIHGADLTRLQARPPSGDFRRRDQRPAPLAAQTSMDSAPSPGPQHP